MRSVYCKFGKLIGFFSLIMVLAGCSFGSLSARAEEKADFSAWIVYWDIESGEQDLQSFSNKLSKLAYFGAYFNEKDRLFVPEELVDLRKKLRRSEQGQEAYLTFVNDKIMPNGSSSIKDIAVLRNVLADAKKQEKHADEMIALAKSGRYDGIEVDYERIWKENGVDVLFLQFIDVLYKKATAAGFKVRVVLEPGIPFDKATFTDGPEYVVMLYNLYGIHGGAGPKATPAFIKSTIRKMSVLPGKKSVALSTGGCRWSKKGERRFLTEAEARALAKRNNAVETRDWESSCLKFRYQENGVWNEVWYADYKTLNEWISAVKVAGIKDISLWRFGGNERLERLN